MADGPPSGPGGGDDDGIYSTVAGGLAGLNPDHPLLQRAQQALKRQLLANKTRLEDELRERSNALKVPMRGRVLACGVWHVKLHSGGKRGRAALPTWHSHDAEGCLEVPCVPYCWASWLQVSVAPSSMAVPPHGARSNAVVAAACSCLPCLRARAASQAKA